MAGAHGMASKAHIVAYPVIFVKSIALLSPPPSSPLPPLSSPLLSDAQGVLGFPPCQTTGTAVRTRMNF